MADITMCEGAGYEICQDCYRRLANPSLIWQSYFTHTPNEAGECDHYLEGYKNARKKARGSGEDTE